MIFVPVREIKEGDRLSQHVYRTDGRLVLAKGAVLTTHLIEGLHRLRIAGVYIDNTRTGDIGGDILNEGEALKAGALEVVRNAFDDVAKQGRFQSRPVNRITDDLIRHFRNSNETSIQMKETRTETSYLIGHSVNVCMLSILTAKALDFSEQHIRTLAIGALLHDIGYVSPDAANPKQDHPRIGFELIRKHPNLPLLSAHIVLQHHEQLNGAGFPMGIKGEEFRLSAQICAIANDFDHFVNEIGMNRLPHEGIEYIMSKVDSCYDISVVRAFVQSVAPYPIGTVVRLTSGLVGKVSELHRGHAARPVITTKDHGLRIDLMHFQTEFIEEVLNDEQACVTS